MNKKLLLSTVALLAGMSLASAQHTPGGQTSGQERSAQSHSGSQLQQGSGEQGRQSQTQRSETRGERNATTGQGSPSHVQQGSESNHAQGAQSGRDHTTGQGSQPSQLQQGNDAHRAQGTQTGREHTTGQGSPSQNVQSQTGSQSRQLGESGRERDLQRNQPAETHGQAGRTPQGQAAQPQPSQSERAQTWQPNEHGQAQQQGQVTTGQTGRAGVQQNEATGGVRLSNEQRTQIRETVLARSDAPRVERSRISFALVTGTVVPSYVRVVEVPDTLVTIDPAWRGDMYFVAGDDIVIVDHSRRIVATIPAGSETQSSAVTTERSGTVTSERSGTMNLSRDEIRQVQLMLNQKGFNIGEPDGVMGPRTKEALMAFQRREGFQASGQIDQQTMAALGMSGTMGRQGGQAQPSTTGERGPAGMNEPNANQRNLNEPGVNQQGTATGQPTGQNRSMTQTPQGQGQSSTNVPSQSHPSTTGQSNVPAQAPATSNPAGSPSMQQRQSR